MYRFTQKFIEDFRNYRSRVLAPVGKSCSKLGITANMMTTFSFLFGLAAVYFVFSQYTLFILFAILHLGADVLDGVIARETKPTLFGKWYDWLVDQLLTVLFIIKIGFHIHDSYAYIAAALYALVQLIYFLSNGKAPILFTRTLTLLLLAIPFSSFPVLAYMVTGVAAMYTLALQIQYGVANKE